MAASAVPHVLSGPYAYDPETGRVIAVGEALPTVIAQVVPMMPMRTLPGVSMTEAHGRMLAASPALAAILQRVCDEADSLLGIDGDLELQVAVGTARDLLKEIAAPAPSLPRGSTVVGATVFEVGQ